MNQATGMVIRVRTGNVSICLMKTIRPLYTESAISSKCKAFGNDQRSNASKSSKEMENKMRAK